MICDWDSPLRACDKNCGLLYSSILFQMGKKLNLVFLTEKVANDIRYYLID